MNNYHKERKQKLISLGADALAEALLKHASHSSEANALIEQLIATPDENVQRFREKLSELKQHRGYIEWDAVSGFAWELEMLLQDLNKGVSDPLTGLKLIAEFYETDSIIMEMCDDSDGEIGDLFSYGAKELFVEYASRCDDKDKVAELILKLSLDNDYGVRDTLIDCAGECLPEKTIRAMVATLQEQEGEGKYYDKVLIESLAKQLKDAELYEKTRIASWGEKLPTAGMIDIARVWLESGDIETAHSWLKKIPEDDTYNAYEQQQLLQEIYLKQGNTEELTKLLFQEFRSCHTTDSLQALLDVIGHEQQNKVVDTEIKYILKNEKFDESDALFLVEISRINEAENYILMHADQLDGSFYGQMLALAKAMESVNRNLTASLLYRCLLISILKRGYAKAYHHGVDYLCQLDKLSEAITDWKGLGSHADFKAQLTEKHGRKRSFWSKYRA